MGTTWAWVVARWRWIAGALALVLAFTVTTCYGRAQYERGQSLARAEVADSIGKLYQARYEAFRDSTAREMASFKVALAEANARADAADARATAAIARANNLPPEIIARTPPEVLTAMHELQGALAQEQVSNRELSGKLADATSLMEKARAALTLADATIAQKDREIGEWKKAKEKPHGFWHTVGTVALDVGLVAGGTAIGKAIFH